MADNTAIRLNEERHQFIIEFEGREAGFAEFDEDGDTWTFTHTVVDPAFEGRGLGSALVHAALDGAREHGKRIIPECPFVAAYIGRHHDWDDLLVS
jgi:predicted GNAT family acetyltransferase